MKASEAKQLAANSIAKEMQEIFNDIKSAASDGNHSIVQVISDAAVIALKAEGYIVTTSPGRGYTISWA
jgi:hypothetical protein